eukprot:CAMPEP_0202489620 /NCGR_PEP_ID=MMETSP1361-20130828/7293_1 /ASSEMBLY_ACC=CAM_ASM_000849 /TAXON_ID=210615 /ORGANISM="Staurosira complex sp., Strain CCMP2646" /LENGTH=170 /DNA_ID=CAMNT_0049119391 /DNA_START=67 /DNA_END=575 /DNA_ORIENTATION=+
MATSSNRDTLAFSSQKVFSSTANTQNNNYSKQASKQYYTTTTKPMILHHLLFSLLLGSQVTQGYHHRSLRAVQATRRLIPKWPYAFLVSHVSFDSGKDWCITAKHGVTDGSDVGFDLCDFDQAPPSQLFMLDDVGKIHTKVDEKQCLVVDQGSRTDLGGARIKFSACDEP